MIALQETADSAYLTLGLALLNVIQTVWLADIAARSRRMRRSDRRKRPPEVRTRRNDRPLG